MTPICFTMALSSVHLERFDAVADLDLVDDVYAADHTPEGGVLAVEVAGRAEHDVDLAPGRIGIVLARHPEDAPLEGPLVELRLDRVAGTAGAHARRFHRQGLRLRIADLDDEPRLDPVEALTVVEPLPRELEEVLHVLGRVGREEFEGDHAAVLQSHDGGRRLGGRLVLGERGRGDEDGERESEQVAHVSDLRSAASSGEARAPLYMPRGRSRHAGVIRWNDASARERS